MITTAYARNSILPWCIESIRILRRSARAMPLESPHRTAELLRAREMLAQAHIWRDYIRTGERMDRRAQAWD